jgi:hypothetical protein
LPQFFWDGSATGFKAAVKQERAETKDDEVSTLFALCEEGVRQPYQANYPVPPLLVEQVGDPSSILTPSLFSSSFFSPSLSLS